MTETINKIKELIDDATIIECMAIEIYIRNKVRRYHDGKL